LYITTKDLFPFFLLPVGQHTAYDFGIELDLEVCSVTPYRHFYIPGMNAQFVLHLQAAETIWKLR